MLTGKIFLYKDKVVDITIQQYRRETIIIVFIESECKEYHYVEFVNNIRQAIRIAKERIDSYERE